jgi:arginyl-tRNA synthetase
VIQDVLARLLSQAAADAAPDIGLDPTALPQPELTRPRAREHGDWAANLALVLAPRVGRSPRDVAAAIAARIRTDGVIDRVEVAGPGFINLFLRPTWLHDTVREIVDQADRFGRAERNGRSVQVEFVSANPVGPLHVGTARNAAIGDSLANVLDAAGYDVEREYYFNDAGRQIELFGESLEARYLRIFGIEADIPEGGYQGTYVADLAAELAKEQGRAFLDMASEERRARMTEEAVGRTMAGIRRTLERFHVRMDTWFSERTLHETGAVQAAVERLRREGFAYEQDGAVFFRSTSFGDEKDRVLVRSNGVPTYVGVDCAYLLNKAERGFDRLIYVLGADHHGWMTRMQGVAKALRIEASFEVVLYQLVSLLRGGEPVRMSKRAGEAVTLDEVIDEVGADAARFTLLSRSADSTIDFDIEVVTRQSMDNPVFYVQYAHARIASLLRVAAQQGVDLEPVDDVDLSLLARESELDLMRTLAELPDVVATAAESLAPHRLTRYAEEAAAAFHRFYAECRVVTEDGPLTQARLRLSQATKHVIASALQLLGVSAPESMERLGDGGEANVAGDG